MCLHPRASEVAELRTASQVISQGLCLTVALDGPFAARVRGLGAACTRSTEVPGKAMWSKRAQTKAGPEHAG